MSLSLHDRVVQFITAHRFPFPGQTTWPAGYVTLANVPEPRQAIGSGVDACFPDILIVDGTGRPREIGEVETVVDPAAVARWRLCSEAADDDTETGVQHFFLYVPQGQEPAAQASLEAAGISYAGLRGFVITKEDAVVVTPFLTPGDSYDHR